MGIGGRGILRVVVEEVKLVSADRGRMGRSLVPADRGKMIRVWVLLAIAGGVGVLNRFH